MDDDLATSLELWAEFHEDNEKADLLAAAARIRELEDAIRYHHEWVMIGNRSGNFSMLDDTLWKVIGIDVHGWWTDD